MRLLRFHLPLFFSSMALLLALVSFYRSDNGKTSAEKIFTAKILRSVRACIEHSESIQEKEPLYTLLTTIEQQNETLETGNDDLRVKFVHSQGCFEHVLACFQALGDIEQIIGVIHTPTPATPLCIKPEGQIDGILDESIRYNFSKLLTVRSRAQIIREYLMKGGKLYVVYPQGGLQKRSSEQQTIYREELERYAGNLIDWVLTTNKIADDMVGATYLFRTPDKQVFSFSIKSRQANDIQPQAEWGLWFGPITEPNVVKRVNDVFDYLAQKGGPDIRQEIL